MTNESLQELKKINLNLEKLAKENKDLLEENKDLKALTISKEAKKEIREWYKLHVQSINEPKSMRLEYNSILMRDALCKNYNLTVAQLVSIAEKGGVE